MNVGLLTSFLVAGLMTLSIYAFNQQVNENTRETAFASNNLQALSEVAEVISNDFSKIGFLARVAPINSIDEFDFSFVGDVYNNDEFGPTTVRWYWDRNDPVTTTSNPNDYYLKRVGPISESTIGETKIPVNYFRLHYYDGSGALTTQIGNIRKVEVEIDIESGEPFRFNSDGEPIFHRTVWKRSFLPNNLNLLF